MSVGALFSPYGDAPPVSTETEDGLRLLDALAAIARSEPRNAPVVLWISRSARLLLRATYTIPSHVTVAFAPGAVFTVGAGAVLNIDGRLEADSGQHFNLVGGKVFLRGPLDEICASWWSGVQSGGAPVAHALSVLWDRYERALAPAPIVLGGFYVLEETLRIAPPDSLVQAFTAPFDVVIRGRHHGRGSPMTFRASSSESVGALDALVAVDGKVVLTLENVGFDLTRPDDLPAVRSALLLAGEHDRSRIEACSFRLAGGTGVHVTALWDAWREAIGETVTATAGTVGPFAPLGGAFVTFLLGAALLASVTGRARRVVIARSDFEGGGATSVGVRVDVVAPTMLDVSDCQFRGEYDRGIAFVGSDLMVTDCAFDNAATATASDPLRAVDIYLGSREPLPDAVPRLAGANAQLTATHCVSTSPTFLVGRRVFNPGDSGGAVLTSVLHQPRTTTPRDVATSVRWIGPCDARNLVLQGCELGAPVRLVDAMTMGIVVELGTRFTVGLPHYVGGMNPMVNLTTANR
ncbi:MAG: hypothetical protein Q8M65_03935 [Rhodoglobus sp.]|nr:hypothetical protein [Rhodoglobus sp.]